MTFVIAFVIVFSMPNTVIGCLLSSIFPTSGPLDKKKKPLKIFCYKSFMPASWLWSYKCAMFI